MKKKAKRTIFGIKGFTISELLTVFAIVSVIGMILWPLIKYNNVRIDRIICEKNLQQTALALYMYALENEGKYPASLKVLYDEKYLSDASLMDCPGSKKVGTIESPDYIYTAGLFAKKSSGEVLVRDKKRNHPGGGMNVLYVNGTVLWKKQ
ncbi:MAG: type II secretion system protein [Candidatus Omnitrophica bacterium]|nr:type II secretion system protein [Candidatus Omnitrophota bacterium]